MASKISENIKNRMVHTVKWLQNTSVKRSDTSDLIDQIFSLKKKKKKTKKKGAVSSEFF